MAFFLKIYLTLILLLRALRDVLIETFQYFVSPIILVMILKRLCRLSLSIRTLWRTRKIGRPEISEEFKNLVIQMKKTNPRWGGQRIVDEFKKNGYNISKGSVLKVLREAGLLSTPPHSRMGWSEFISAHDFRVGVDFTCVFDLLGRQYFIFVILDLESRAILGIGATLSPNRDWITQQFRNAFLDLNDYPSLCISDRDSIYGHWLEVMLKDYYGTELIHIPFRQPWKNGRVERFHRSLKEEAFHNFIPITEDQVQALLQ